MGHITRHPRLDQSERVIRCPNCRDEYLHQGRVLVFDRLREGAATIATSVDRGRVSTADPKGNPSPYRNGLVIAFDCEGCGRDDLSLAIWQHKGMTFWRWQ